MKLNTAIYPYNLEARKFPIHLTGIGGTDWQQPVARPMGYQWHQIFISESGEGMLKYDNITLTVNPGDCFFLPAEYPHEYCPAQANWQVKFVTFDGYSAAHILSLLGMTKPTVITPAETSAFISLFGQMYALVTKDKLYGDIMCTGLVYQLVLEFSRHMNKPASRAKIERTEALSEVLGYITEHYKEDFPLTVLSEIAGVTQQHFCRIFKDSMGMRPKEYIISLRIREAKKLLTETDKTIAEIALNVGFSEAAYFCAVFKRLERLSPLEYRRASAGFIS